MVSDNRYHLASALEIYVTVQPGSFIKCQNIQIG